MTHDNSVPQLTEFEVAPHITTEGEPICMILLNNGQLSAKMSPGETLIMSKMLARAATHAKFLAAAYMTFRDKGFSVNEMTLMLDRLEENFDEYSRDTPS